MTNRIGIKNLFPGAIILALSVVGCSTTRQSTDPALASRSHHPDSGRAPVVLDQTQVCRDTLHRIQGAKHRWALEKRQLDSAVPTNADLFGPGVAYLPERPKCPSGGSYTFGAGEDVPLCSMAGHTY
jgi:hypothetical protein